MILPAFIELQACTWASVLVPSVVNALDDERRVRISLQHQWQELGQPEEKQYRFLLCIESLIKMIEHTSATSNFRSVVTAIKAIVEKCEGNGLSEPGQNGDQKSGEKSLHYQSQLVEVLIGAMALGVATGKIVAKAGDRTDHLDALIYAYKFVPINPRYARYALQQFARKDVGRLEI